MSDDVIKNPARNEPRFMGYYEPEYKRLNKEPIITNPKKFDFMENKPKEKSVSDVPEQTHVFVGRNQNWFETSKEVIEASIKNESLEILDEPKEPEFKSVVDELEKNVDEVMEKPQLKIDSLEIGNYCLFYKGELLTIDSYTNESITEFIESIIFGSDSKYEGLSVNDLILVKRLPIKVGVLVVE